MKASASVKNFKSQLSMSRNFAYRQIRKICAEIGPRPCGYEPETKAQEYIAGVVGDFADEVKTEEFSVHPKAFLGWTKIASVLVVIGVALLNLGYAAYAFIPAALALYCIVFEFLLYKEAIDFLYKKRTSRNVSAVYKAKGEVKRRIFIGGHIDSSYEWHSTYYGGAPLMFFVFIYAALGLGWVVIAAAVACAKGFAAPGIGGVTDMTVSVFNYIAYAFVPGEIMLFFFLGTHTPVMGANDNLTGVLSSAAVLQFLHDNDIRFENTEIVFLSTGGEEAGLRGAKAYAKAHGEEIRNSGVETCFLAIDTLRDYECFGVYKRDLTGLFKQSDDVCELVRTAGLMSGVEMQFSSIYAGASDAAAFGQAGIKSVCLAAMNPGPPRYYHTRLDTVERLEQKTIEKGIEMALNTVFLFDEQGLKEKYDLPGDNGESENADA